MDDLGCFFLGLLSKCKDWSFHDSEDMEGIEEYQPLKQVMELEIPCLYSNCSMDPWPLKEVDCFKGSYSS